MLSKKSIILLLCGRDRLGKKKTKQKNYFWGWRGGKRGSKELEYFQKSSLYLSGTTEAITPPAAVSVASAWALIPVERSLYFNQG